MNQQSIDDLIQLLIEFKTFELSQSSSKIESSFSKTESFKKTVVSNSSVAKYSSLFESSSSSSQSESFDKRSLKRERSDVESFRSHNESIESIKDEIIAMNLANRIEKMKKRHQAKRNVTSADVDQANIVNEKRAKFVSRKYPKFDYAQFAWIEEKWDKISEFHVAFMTELMKFERFLIENQIDFQIDAKEESTTNRIHISTLLSSSAHWRAMLRHSHDEEFEKAAQMKFEAISSENTWEIMNKSSISDHQKIISLKWIFIYKNDSDDYLTKYKARTVMKDDLQNADSQDVYAATLTSKVFRMLMTLMIAFHLKTRQLDAVNAFLNAHNDESVYCQMSDDYRLDDKCYRVIRALYDQRKSSLLWFRILIIKCLKLRLKSISEKSCLFINEDDIIMFFYVNDIVFAYRTNRKRVAESYIARLKSMFRNTRHETDQILSRSQSYSDDRLNLSDARHLHR